MAIQSSGGSRASSRSTLSPRIGTRSGAVLSTLLWFVGSLAVDVSNFGVVMSADSQPVEIVGGENRVLAGAASRATRDPILTRGGGGFTGLVGFVGTKRVENVPTADWLCRFSGQWSDDDVGAFCTRLAETLTGVWRRDALPSVLEILVTGEVSGQL